MLRQEKDKVEEFEGPGFSSTSPHRSNIKCRRREDLL
jgi:hypothetical protein